MVNSETTRVTALYIYPIKSCRGISVQSAELLKEGLEFDRRWMFIDAATSKFMTIRQNSRMTLIRPSLRQIHGRDAELVITVKGEAGEIAIPARPSHAELDATTTVRSVEIWGKQIQGHVYDASVSALVSKFLQQDVLLVHHVPETGLRQLGGNGSLTSLGRTGSVGYADVLPVLLASQASLRELNDRLRKREAEEVTIERFRPNIVVEGLDAWDEDTWSLVALMHGTEGKIVIDVVCHCARCQVPNVGPDSGEKDKHEPWDTLMTYRRIDEGIKWKPCFGMLGVPRGYDGLGPDAENVNVGTIYIGDFLRVEERTTEHVYEPGF